MVCTWQGRPVMSLYEYPIKPQRGGADEQMEKPQRRFTYDLWYITSVPVPSSRVFSERQTAIFITVPAIHR